jgi:LPXTG-site transpeptidase (sortase) family protein
MSFFKPHKYIKDESSTPIYKTVNTTFVVQSLGYPVISVSLGLFILITQIIIPVVSFKTSNEISKPVRSSVLGVASGFRDFEFSELENGVGDIREANVPDYYYLTVPKLDIDRAKVETHPPDLNPEDSLGHYVGSAYPGEVGNTFLYGHSVLPTFYNPKNYMAIFSTIHTLDIGDEFTIEYNNKKYNYAVEQKRTKKPEELDPLAGYKPAYLGDSTVTLMTCSPPGTKIKRLMVDAVLID